MANLSFGERFPGEHCDLISLVGLVGETGVLQPCRFLWLTWRLRNRIEHESPLLTSGVFGRSVWEGWYS